VKKRIAIVGTGISGLTCGYLLHSKHDIQVFESNNYLGGHTHTVDVEVEGRHYAIDTGFIVYNDWTYPNFIKLMNKVGVISQATEMSFSVKNQASGLEYNGHGLNSLFAQRRNLLSPRFYAMLSDIAAFNKACKVQLASDQNIGDLTLGAFIQQLGLGKMFSVNYILPMCAAIWSSSLQEVQAFPLKFFLHFFNNHGLLNITHRPQWYTLVGGSREYIRPLTKSFSDKITLNCGIQSVEKLTEGGYRLRTTNQQTLVFDEVILACHSDQALAMLNEPNSQQQDILSAIAYAPNEVILHTDTRILPQRKLAWASWNYLLKGHKDEAKQPACVTYNMNILQKLSSETTFCVTLNNNLDIAEDKILRRFNYSHPQFSQASVWAQKQRQQICGIDGLHFCGAYWYNGFHEDGVRSALDVCQRFGIQL